MKCFTILTLTLFAAMFSILTANAQMDIAELQAVSSTRTMHSMVMSTSTVKVPSPLETKWVPNRILWSNHLLHDTTALCNSWINSSNARYRIQKSDGAGDMGKCVVMLYDAVGDLRTTANWNHEMPRKRLEHVRLYLAMTEGNTRFGVYTLDTLTQAVKAVR